MNPLLPGLPIISLWQPWAQWVSLGWKPIETRTHNRFAGLVGRRIGIHAAVKWDHNALALASNYLTPDQIQKTDLLMRIGGGAVICTAKVAGHRLLQKSDETGALIECGTKRFGLILEDIEIFTPIPAKGKQGIWYLS